LESRNAKKCFMNFLSFFLSIFFHIYLDGFQSSLIYNLSLQTLDAFVFILKWQLL
jgi:hypothetical protein